MGQAEIHQLDFSIRQDHYVFGFQITMYNPVSVNFMQCGTNLQKNPHNFCELFWDLSSERFALQQLNHHEWDPIEFTGIVNRNDIRVVDFGYRLCFLIQAVVPVNSQVLFLEHFYGYISLQPGVVCLVNNTHKTIAKFSIETVPAIDQRI